LGYREALGKWLGQTESEKKGKHDARRSGETCPNIGPRRDSLRTDFRPKRNRATEDEDQEPNPNPTHERIDVHGEGGSLSFRISRRQDKVQIVPQPAQKTDLTRGLRGALVDEFCGGEALNQSAPAAYFYVGEEHAFSLL
jgi:hypothetical protein